MMIMRGRLRSLAMRIIRRVIGAMPSWASTTTQTVSTAGKTEMAMPAKSASPGVSIMLTMWPS